MIGGFIPNRISGRTVAKVLDILRRIQRRLHIARRSCLKHKNANKIAIDRVLGSFGEHKPGTGTGQRIAYLESQNSCRDVAYGKSDMAYAGCEVIAVYNALLAMGRRADLGELLEHFESDGMVLSGRFGTAPYAIRDYLESAGLSVRTVYDHDGYDEAADAADVSVLMMYNDRRSIFRKVHTVCITRDDAGYTSHNTYCDGRIVGPFPTCTELIAHINSGYARGIVLFAISAEAS